MQEKILINDLKKELIIYWKNNKKAEIKNGR
jgi:hypothetical protein